MRKLTVAACAAGVLASAILGLGGPRCGGGAARAPCSVHVSYPGSDVNVDWR